MTVGSLFAGIGGFDLGFERAGFEIKWQVEIDPFCRAVLAKHWPNVRRYEDVRTIHGAMAHADGASEASESEVIDCEAMVGAGLGAGGGVSSGHSPARVSRFERTARRQCCLPAVDVLVGGFPCQPHSLAGRRGGSADERDLWPSFARLIRELRPRWVVAENVPGLLSSDAGRFFGTVLGDLAACGYDAEWDCLPASAFGAPHRRDRVWIVAYPNAERRTECGLPKGQRQSRVPDIAGSGRGGASARGKNRERCRFADVADADLARLEGRQRAGVRERAGERTTLARGASAVADAARERWRSRRTEPARFFGATGPERCGWWESEPNVGRVAHGIPARVDRLRGLGNAIVPQIAQWIAERIKEAEGVAA